MSKVFKDIIPANANIEIEYGREDTVKFSYPISWTYRKAVFKRAFPTILTFFMLAFLKFIMFIAFIFVVLFLFYVALFRLGFIPHYEIIFNMNKISGYSELIFPSTLVLFIFFMLFPFALSLKKEWLSSLMTKFGYYSIVLLGRTKEKYFITTDVIDNRCIIPNFSNVFLDYKATGDFNKYLKNVKILAYDFKYHVRQRIAIFIKHKREQNDYVYYALFEFSKTPVDGYLECEYY